MSGRFLMMVIFLMLSSVTGLQSQDNREKTYSLTANKGLELVNVTAKSVNLTGKSGIEVTASNQNLAGETLVIIPDCLFMNGTIEIELSGDLVPGADPQMRGFVGIAFRVDPANYSYYDCFYIRPKNGRAENQLRRNHSTQYIAHPEYPWHRLRRESPGVYESYVDLVPGEWTAIKLIISGKTGRFYVNNTEQPALIVNDLKHPEKPGLIGLWLHSSTLARFRNLRITAAQSENP